MKIFLLSCTIILTSLFAERIAAQGFPDPDSLSTGQGTQGSADPIWQVSGWYGSPTNPSGISFIPALISNNCASGSWVTPDTLTPPENNANWITNPNYPCATNTNAGYIDYRLTITLPPACDGQSVSAPGAYTLYLSGYADNLIDDVYVNNVSTGITGGNFSNGSALNMTLAGPWNAGVNYVDIQVYNQPGGSGANPYGLLLVANNRIGYSNGCPPQIVGDTVICQGQTTTLRANQTGLNYVWSTGATIDSITVTPGATTGYTVTASNNYGYTVTVSTTVTVNIPPVVTANPATPAICTGNSATITAGGAISYVWSTTDNTTAITVSPTINTTYTVTGTDANSCTASANSSVTVNQLPTIGITPATQQICPGSSATLTGTGAVGYLWSTSQTINPISVTPANNAIYTVIGTDANGCTGSASGTVTVNAAPVPVITPQPVQICLGADTILTTSGGVSYVWNTTEATAMITVTPTTTTTYTVTATDANNCTGSVSGTVTVNQPPNAQINPPAIGICVGNSTTLTASGGFSYIWSTMETTPAINVSPTTTTTYGVLVTDANNCTATAASVVTVNQLPVVTVNPASATICMGTGTTLFANGGISYLWSDARTTESITVSPNTTTTYIVTATDANSCSASALSTVTVNPLPTPAITPVASRICLGADTILTATGGLVYAWSDGDTTAATEVYPANTTTYTVTAFDANGCSNTARAIVEVVQRMVLTLDTTGISCNGAGDGAIYLKTTNGLPPYTYVWNTGSNAANLSNLPAGGYYVIVTDNAGCSATATDTLSDPKVLSFTNTDVKPTCVTVDHNGSISLTVDGGTAPYDYNWAGDATGTASVLPDLTQGSYQVTVTDAHGCSTTGSFALTYVYHFSIQASFAATITLGQSTQLSSFTSGGNLGTYTTSWSPVTGLSCTDCQGPLATPNVTTLYHVEIKNEAGCTASDTVTVTVIPDYDLFIPNAFTPNNDGKNDVFQIYGNLQAINYLEVRIFDRWGELVYSSNDPNFEWDGTFKGNKAFAGVYSYEMKLVFDDGHPGGTKIGTVTLLR